MSKHRSILSTWNVWYKSRLIGQYDCWSLRCSWNIACRRCSSYIFILDLAPGFNGLGKDNCKTKRLSFNYCDMVRIIFEILPNKNSDIITPKQNTARPWAYFMGWAAICGKLMWWFDSHCYISLRWRHNGCDSVPNHQPRECLLRRLIRRTSKKTSKLRVTGLCAGNSPETGEFPAQMASNAENVSIWWRHHVLNTFVHIHVTGTTQQTHWLYWWNDTDQTDAIVSCWCVIEWMLGPVLLTLLRHVARILANGRAAFFESCDAIGWNSCDVSQKR